jgi:hypothetical protein
MRCLNERVLWSIALPQNPGPQRRRRDYSRASSLGAAKSYSALIRALRSNRVRSIDDASRQVDRNRSRRCKRDGPLSKTRPECDRNHESRQDRRLPADRKSATESHKSSCAQPPRSRARASRPIKHWNRCHGVVRRYRSVRRAVRAAIRGRTTHARCLPGDRCGSGYPQPMRRVGESSCSRAGRITAEPSLRRYIRKSENNRLAAVRRRRLARHCSQRIRPSVAATSGGPRSRGRGKSTR